ncbi:Cell surface hyaluronidase [Saguinus oedipus]|uniref:Cell surface hyaluronidase n=1 Tax=Saguinus oedipus TaxID=9490 RepID=A0ABQ9WDZ6_SAGOE|nr:Cell surface hyaluronidase [Saguinus oedipus]
MIQDRLGSDLIQGLGYRQAWALVGVIDGGSTSCNESVRNYENHSSGGKALAQREFYTVDGQKFSVTAYSEWIEGVALSGFRVEAVDGVKLNLLDDVVPYSENLFLFFAPVEPKQIVPFRDKLSLTCHFAHSAKVQTSFSICTERATLDSTCH